MLKTFVKKTVVSLAVATGFSIGIVIYKVWRHRKSNTHSWDTAAKHYFSLLFLRILGKNSFKQLMRDSNSIRDVQARALLEALELNKDTKFGTDHDFSDIKSVQDFLEKIPIENLNDYKSYVDKILNGSCIQSLTKKTPIIMGKTSGTTLGSGKVMPTTEDILMNFFTSG